MPVAIINSGRDDLSKYNLEAGRLESFDKWPHASNLGQISKQNMAKAGFFYSGTNDRVKCFVCNIKLEGWDPEEDEPWQRHQEASPECLFAKFRKEEGELTVEQFVDVFCGQALNKLGAKLRLP